MFASYRLSWVPLSFGHFQKTASVEKYNLDDNVDAKDLRAPGARWYRLVYLYEAQGGPLASLCICSPPMRRWRSGRSQGLQWQTNGLRDGPDFQRTPTTNILRTCFNARIKYILIRERRSARPSK